MTHPAENGAHEDGCPEARPWLYGLDERPLECICADLRADAEWDIPPEGSDQ